MSQFVDFLEDLLHERLSDIDLGMIGRIERFDKEKMRADVTPLLKKKSMGEEQVEYAVICEVPVNFIMAGEFYVRPEYKVGDLVHISFSTHDIEESLRDQKPLASEKIFSSENAFVVGGVAKTGWSHPAEFSEPGLLIGHKDGGAFMKFENSAIKFKVGANEVVIDEAGISTTKDLKADGDMLGDAKGLNISLNKHGHNAPFGPTISKIPQGEA